MMEPNEQIEDLLETALACIRQEANVVLYFGAHAVEVCDLSHSGGVLSCTVTGGEQLSILASELIGVRSVTPGDDVDDEAPPMGDRG